MNPPAGQRYWDGRIWTAHVRPPGTVDDVLPPGEGIAVTGPYPPSGTPDPILRHRHQPARGLRATGAPRL